MTAHRHHGQSEGREVADLANDAAVAAVVGRCWLVDYWHVAAVVAVAVAVAAS